MALLKERESMNELMRRVKLLKLIAQIGIMITMTLMVI